MPLPVGKKLGPYEIQSAIGAGGMGEVYRARDTRLERTVAIKILNAQLVDSPELRARFNREAKVISQLQHTNICVLHDVGSENGTDYLVMEFLEGESLSDRLKKGPLPTEELLRIALQLADALEKAHRAGVVHRDLKPGNVMLTKSGAKLLDFGLAKPLAAGVAAGTGSGKSASVFAALTQTSPAPSPASPLSAAGSVIGTVQYMSPEQIQGMEADVRSDIFAFGVMLFEMATGKRAFEGKTQASVVGQILAVDPPSASTLAPATPPGLDRVIRICLEKDPDERIQTAHDLKLQLQAIAETPAAAAQSTTAAPSRMRWLPWAVAGALAIAAIAIGWLYLQSQRAALTSVHSYILAPEKTSLVVEGNIGGMPVLSPDGLRVAFIAKPAEGKQMLWVQPLNSAVAQPLAGTEGAMYPFWSADSRYVAFFANGKLNKVDATGGPPQALCEAPSGRGGTWNSNGTIVFAATTTTGLMRVDAGGGMPSPLTTLDTAETSHRWPDFLPDGKHFLYFAHGVTSANSGIFVGSLDAQEHKLLLHNDSNGIYAVPGYLLFVRDNTLMAQPFDPSKLALTGDAKPIADHVSVNNDVWRGIATASMNGELLYQHGADAGGSQLVWFDRTGKQGQPVLPDTGQYYAPALSPDGTKLAAQIDTNGIGDIWVVDLLRNTKTRITFDPQGAGAPVWWPDGKSIVFATGGAGTGGTLSRKNADGTGAAEKLLSTPGVSLIPMSVSPDGQYVAYMRLDSKTKTDWDLYALPLSGDKQPIPLVTTPYLDAAPNISPDGKWIAYSNNESGRQEVYIQLFPSGPGKWEVSTAGGNRPKWRKDGKELFFESPADEIMAVEVAANGSSLQLGSPHALFKVTTVSGASGPYTVAPDGKRFVMNVIIVPESGEPLTLVTNWTADLKK